MSPGDLNVSLTFHFTFSIAAVDWVTQQATNVTFRPSIGTISLHFSPSDVLDAAVTNVRI